MSLKLTIDFVKDQYTLEGQEDPMIPMLGVLPERAKLIQVVSKLGGILSEKLTEIVEITVNNGIVVKRLGKEVELPEGILQKKLALIVKEILK